MAGSLQHVLGRLYGLAGRRDSDSPDQQLLERFTRAGDTDAFATLVQRHGGLVWGVCRRLMAHDQDAEDVFQAAFMLLARKAAAIRSHEALGPWLYRVAYHLGVKARGRQARRRERERAAMAVHHEQSRAVDVPEADTLRRELLECLDRELNGLPDKYRAPLVLCDLQGKSHEEAARELACPAGSMSRHLLRGRELLRERLAGRGVALTAAALAAYLTDSARAGVPPSLMQRTSTHAVSFAAGGSLDAAALPAANLARGALRSMFISKLKVVSAGLAGAVVLIWLGAWAASAAFAPVDPENPAAPLVPDKAVGKAKVVGALEFKLIANRTHYEVNLGGRAPAEFRKFLETSDVKPAPAEVDLVLEIKNISDKPVSFWSSGDPVQLDWQLTGPDALTINSDLTFTAEFRAARSTVLAPGQVHRYELRSLASGARGLSNYTYWLSPGDYQLAVAMRTAISPAPKGTEVEEGFGKCLVTTEPIAIRVKQGKGAPGVKKDPPTPHVEAVPPGKPRGGQGGGVAPVIPPAVDPDKR